MELKKVWHKADNCLFLRDVSTNVKNMENAIYVLDIDPRTGELFLRQIGEKFEFDFKIYGLERPFIERVKKTYANTKGNLGVLLNGVKGTGKTITAEILANELEMPIIMINTPFGGANTFLSSIQQDVIILIDEYEKVYKGNIGDGDNGDDDNIQERDSSLLSLMDGALKTRYRKVFILTTNRTYINDNMLNRPGRLRYRKEFSDLTMGQITEILDDCLIRTEFRQSIIDFMKPLKIITVDIVKSIITEVNIHNESPDICCKDFNLEFKDEVYDIVKLGNTTTKKSKDIVIATEVPINTVSRFTTRIQQGSTKSLYIVHDDNIYYAMDSGHDIEKGIYKVYDGNFGGKEKPFMIRFDKQKGYHTIFSAY